MIIWGCRDVWHIRIRGTSPLLQIWVGGVGLYGCRVRRVPLLSRMCPDNLSVVVGAEVEPPSCRDHIENTRPPASLLI